MPKVKYKDHKFSAHVESMIRQANLRESMAASCGKRGLLVNRLALNMDQVEEYAPPPNPAKITDSRASAYIERFGDESWELDALDPATLNDLVRQAVEGLRDEALWEAAVAREQRGLELLREASRRWEDVERMLED